MSVRGEASLKAESSSSSFSFQTGELVLVKWGDGMVYFAKIKRIDRKRGKCTVVFDDKSHDEAEFDQIHSVDETTTDIICIKCKKDDSDSPNEIVLCDTCGIGFHQKCHVPPIPAHALELDTPWNCIYCQKGAKCPYLTESLDVLQNLLSDDELSRDGDAESLVTVESDREEYEGATKVTIMHGPARRKKGRRGKLGHKRGFKPLSPGKIAPGTPGRNPSTISPEAWRHKLASTSHPRSSTSPPREMEVLSSPGSSVEAPAAVTGRKRKKLYVAGGLKKQKRSSVESRTVSVQRLPGLLLDDSSTSEQEQSHDSPTCSHKEPSLPPVSSEALPLIKEEPRSVDDDKRPRSLRVSLSIPDEVEPGTPLDKVVNKASSGNRLQGTPAGNLPSWEEIPTKAYTQMSSKQQASPPLRVSETSTTVRSPAQHQVVELPTAPMLASSPKRELGHKRKLSESALGIVAGEANAPKQPDLGAPSPPISDDVFETKETPPKVQPRGTPPRLGKEKKPRPGTVKLQAAVTSSEGPTESTEPPTSSHAKVKSLPKSEASPALAHNSGVPVVAMLASPLPKNIASIATSSPEKAPSPPLPTPLATDQPATTLPKSPGERDTSQPTEPNPKPIQQPSGFIQGQLVSKVVVSTITTPTATRVIEYQRRPQKPPGALYSKGAAATKLTHTPVQSPVSSNGGQKDGRTTVVMSTLPTYAESDVFITGVERKDIAVGYMPPQRPHQLRTSDSRPKKVVAKSMDILPSHGSPSPLRVPSYVGTIRTPTASQNSVSVHSEDILPSHGSPSPLRAPSYVGTIRTPTASQISVSAHSVVVTPDAYSTTSSVVATPDALGKAYLIPSAGVGQMEQVMYALPVSETKGSGSVSGISHAQPLQPQVRYVIKEPSLPQKPPPPYRPPAPRATPIVASGVAPTTLVYTQAAPVAHSLPEQGLQLQASHEVHVAATQHRPNQPQPGVVYYTVPSTQASQLSTTKPYAIVSALPSPAESRGVLSISPPQTANSHGGVHLQFQSTSGQVAASGSRGQVGLVSYTHQSQRKHKSPAMSKADSGAAVTQRENAHEDDLALQAITRKIGTAFSSYNENMLLAAFEDAWKKFQANGKKYEALARLERSVVKAPTSSSSSRPHCPPNAEVICTPGISRLSLVRPANARPKPIVPKPLPSTAGTPLASRGSLPPSTSAVPAQSQQYITYAYTAGTSHPQVIVQPVNSSDSPYTIYTVAPKPPVQKSHQSGLYYPGQAASEGSAASHKPDTGAPTTSATHQQVVIAQPVLQHPRVQMSRQVSVTHPSALPGPTHIVSTPKIIQHLPRKQKQSMPVRRRAPTKSTRSCALCGREATYLCSGCHSEWYCGRDCQLKAWDDHSDHCKA